MRLAAVVAVAIVSLPLPPVGVPLALGLAGYLAIVLSKPNQVVRGRTLSTVQHRRAAIIVGSAVCGLAAWRAPRSSVSILPAGWNRSSLAAVGGKPDDGGPGASEFFALPHALAQPQRAGGAGDLDAVRRIAMGSPSMTCVPMAGINRPGPENGHRPGEPHGAHNRSAARERSSEPVVQPEHVEFEASMAGRGDFLTRRN